MRNNSEELIRLARQEFSQLTDADKKLFRAVARHEVANFKADVDELNQPESSEQWGSERTLKVDRIVWLLTTSEASKLISFQGLRISGAKIEGELNLKYAQVSVPLIFNTCAFTEPLILQKSKLRELQLKGSYVSGIQAEKIDVKGSVYLSNGFTAVGEVNLKGASIGVQLDCSGGVFFYELNIISIIFLLLQAINSMSGPIFYFYVRLLRKLPKTTLNANGATITASVFLRNGFKAVGEVNLRGVSIGGQLNCSGGEFSNQGKIAISADAAKIAADVFLRNGFKAEGEVILRGASIGGQLSCIGGEFLNEEGVAIDANAAKIAADVLLSNKFKAEGEVDLHGASIGGQLDCSEGEFSNEGEIAINADAATITGDLFLRDKFKAEGEVNLIGASIGGNIYCTGGQFLNQTGNALDAEGAKISGSVFLGGKYNNSQFKAKGKMIFLNANIDDRFELSSIESNNFASMKLDLRFAKVNTFSFKDRQAEKSWSKQIKQGQLFLNGFVYNTINVTNAAIKGNILKKWLQLQIKKYSDSQSDRGFFLQPYEQLAKVLKTNGHQEAATKVLITKEEDRFKYGGLSCWGKIWNRILGVAISHGYRPEKALIYSFIMILVGWGVFSRNQGLMTETKVNPWFSEVNPWSSDDAFNPLFYSIDTFTPVIDLHQQKMWLPDPSRGKDICLLFFKTRQGDLLRYYFWFQIIAGWVLTSLWVAGFTGLVRSQK